MMGWIGICTLIQPRLRFFWLAGCKVAWLAFVSSTGFANYGIDTTSNGGMLNGNWTGLQRARNSILLFRIEGTIHCYSRLLIDYPLNEADLECRLSAEKTKTAEWAVNCTRAILRMEYCGVFYCVYVIKSQYETALNICSLTISFVTGLAVSCEE